MFSLIECVLYVFLWQKNTLRISVTLTVKKKKKSTQGIITINYSIIYEGN